MVGRICKFLSYTLCMALDICVITKCSLLHMEKKLKLNGNMHRVLFQSYGWIVLNSFSLLGP